MGIANNQNRAKQINTRQYQKAPKTKLYFFEGRFKINGSNKAAYYQEGEHGLNIPMPHWTVGRA